MILEKTNVTSLQPAGDVIRRRPLWAIQLEGGVGFSTYLAGSCGSGPRVVKSVVRSVTLEERQVGPPLGEVSLSPGTTGNSVVNQSASISRS